MMALLLLGGICLYVNVIVGHEPPLKYNKIMFCCPDIAV